MFLTWLEILEKLTIDLFNVIVFIRATDHYWLQCYATWPEIVDGKNISGSIDTNWFKPNFTWKINHFWLIFNHKFYLVF